MSSSRILLLSIRMGRFFALLLPLAFSTARAQQDAKTWHVLIEPAFMHPEVSFPIPFAKRTLLVPGYLSEGQPQYFSKKDWDAAGLTWDAFRARAAQNATQKKFTAQLVRDRNKIVQYAAITSGDPLTATMILAPTFLEKFQDIFGPAILVAVPNRFTVYVFPKLASEYKEYSSLVIGAYHDSAYPVSLEVFEISRGGIRAIGIFDDED